MAAAVPMVVELMADQGIGLMAVLAATVQRPASFLPFVDAAPIRESVTIPRSALTGPARTRLGRHNSAALNRDRSSDGKRTGRTAGPEDCAAGGIT